MLSTKAWQHDRRILLTCAGPTPFSDQIVIINDPALKQSLAHLLKISVLANAIFLRQSCGMTVAKKEVRAQTGRTARTRASLLESGRKLFAERPFDAVAIDDIVHEAGVAKGTFYNHFDDKDALLVAIVTDIRERIEAKVKMVNAEVADPAARIARAICVYAAMAADDPIQAHILLRNDPRGSARYSLNDGLREDLTAGLRSGQLMFPTIEAGLLFVIGIVHSLLLVTARSGERLQPILTTQQLCSMMLRSFGLEHRLAELVASQAADDIIRLRAYDSDEV